MDWTSLLLLASGVVFLIALGLFAWAAIMRMAGRRSRFDGLAEAFVRSQGAAIYPPSLRGDPNPPVIEEIEDSRAARASTTAPNATQPNPPQD